MHAHTHTHRVTFKNTFSVQKLTKEHYSFMEYFAVDPQVMYLKFTRFKKKRV